MENCLKERSFFSGLEDLGYKFNTDGQLRKIDRKSKEASENQYEFNISEDPVYNQKYYETVGEVITEVIYEMMEHEGLVRLNVPRETENASFIFASKNYATCEQLLILIHGSGVVRAGQWSRRLIINDKLDSGSQLPFIRKALSAGYGILVFNTNEVKRYQDGKCYPIEGSSTAEEHARTVWSSYVKDSSATKVAIVAHSYGAAVVIDLINKFQNDFLEKVCAVAFTDGVGCEIPTGLPSNLRSHVLKICRNWVSCNKALDIVVRQKEGSIVYVSAGCKEHEMTSFSSISSIFQFIDEHISA